MPKKNKFVNTIGYTFINLAPILHKLMIAMKIYEYRCLLVIAFALFAASCGSASPSTPTSIPTAIEFAGADMVVSMGGSLSLTSNADFSAGQVKFTDFATGDEDTSGICGSSSIDGTDIEITGPDTWPNLQSECGVCFEYDGACLPVDHSIAASLSSQLNPLWDEATANEDVITVDTGVMNIGFEITPADDIKFDSVEQGYLTSIKLVNYESDLGTNSAVSEMHFCGFLLENDSPSRLIHAVSSDNLVTVSSYEYLSAAADYLTQNCGIDVRDNANGNKITAVAGVGFLCYHGLACQDKRAVLYVNGSAMEVTRVSSPEADLFHLDGVAIDSGGNVHVVYHYDGNIYHSLCSSSSCGDAVTVATGIREEDDEGLSVYMASYEDIVYVAYTRDHDGDGYADAMVRTISGSTVGDETRWSSATTAKGTAMIPIVDTYRNLTSQELITAVAYSYETIMDGFVSISPGTEYQFTDVALGSATKMGALVISKGGYIYIGYNITDVSSATHARYSRGEISNGEISNGIVAFPQVSILATDTVVEYRGSSFLSRVGRFYYLYERSVQTGEIYSMAPIGTVIGRGQ